MTAERADTVDPVDPEGKLRLLRRLRQLDKKTRRLCGRVLESLSLTGTQGQVLGFVFTESARRDVFQRDIEEEFQIRKPTVTGILKLLEKNGQLRRQSVPGDARLKKIVPTAKARRSYGSILRQLEAIEAALSANLSEREIRSFLRLVDKICSGL